LAGLLLGCEDGGITFVRNAGLSTNCTTLLPRREHLSNHSSNECLLYQACSSH
jgi:hypothetical protein